MKQLFALVLLVVLVAACNKDEVTKPDPNNSIDTCGTVAMPLSGSADAPSVTDVGLEVQASGIVIVATVTDPQGSANLLHVNQSIGIFPEIGCGGAVIVLVDDIAYSGVEETFGTVVDAAADPALYNAIKAAGSWPAQVELVDLDGNRTSGRVRARIIH
jgi:hypothetical protein